MIRELLERLMFWRQYSYITKPLTKMDSRLRAYAARQEAKAGRYFRLSVQLGEASNQCSENVDRAILIARKLGNLVAG